MKSNTHYFFSFSFPFLLITASMLSGKTDKGPRGEKMEADGLFCTAPSNIQISKDGPFFDIWWEGNPSSSSFLTEIGAAGFEHIITHSVLRLHL